jgi:hypothetical protein
MAQPLTWRDVAAPDFSGAQRGQAQAAAMLNAALTTAGSGLAKFDDTQSDIVNQEAQRQLLQYQDPAALQAALKSGALFAGLDPARIRATTMNDANSRVSNLLSTAASTENLAQGVYDNQQKNAERLREQDARGGFAAYNEKNGGLPASLVGQLPVPMQGQLRTGDLTAKGTVRDLRELGRTDNIRDFSLAIAPRIQQMSPNALRGMLDSGQWSPEQYAVINELGAKLHGGALFGPNATIDAYDPNSYRPAGSAAPANNGAPVTAGTTGFGTKAGSPWDSTVGFQPTPVPVSSMSIADAIDYGKKTLIPGNKGNAALGLPPTLGSSAMGAYQITGQTLQDFAPKALGANWQSAPMSPENQEKIAEAIFNDRKSGNLKSTWVSLPNAAPGAYKNMPWSEARKIIAGGEVGANNLEVPSGSAPTQASTMIATAASPRPTGTIVDQIPGYSGPLVAAPASRSASGLIGNATAGTVNPVTTVLPPTPAEAALATSKVPALPNATAAKMYLEDVKKETNYNTSLLPIANDSAAFTPSAQGVPELAQELLKMPEFAGAESRQLIDQMNKMVQQKVAPRVAAAILKNSVTDQSLWTGFNWINPMSATDNISGTWGSKVVDEATRDNLVKLAAGNTEIGKIQSNNEVQKGFSAAQDAKLAEITKLEADRLTQKIRADQNLPGAKERYDAMTVQYEKKLQEFQTSLTAFQKAKAEIKNKK